MLPEKNQKTQRMINFEGSCLKAPTLKTHSKNQISEDLKPLQVYIYICNKCIKCNNFIKHSTLYLTYELNILHTA